MAIDQTSPTTDPADAAVIDNEFPAYRAISPGAVICLFLGIGSVFCFTDLWFLVVVGLAIAVGLLALRKIRRLSDVLTGAIYAKTGIALALIFGLSSVTHQVASSILVDLDAGRFAVVFTEVIKTQPVEATLWYQQPPEYRKTKKPSEIADEIREVKNPSTPNYYRDRTESVEAIKERLKGPGEQIRFSKIESKATDGLTIYANALLELDGPGSTENPEKEQFALLEITKGPGVGSLDWVVKDVKYPYKPASATLTVEKKHDDGHGH